MSLTSTITAEAPRITIEATREYGFPPKLDEKYSRTPKLTREQCGHLRHFHNLASQIDGEWSLMGSQDPGQEWDTAYRYQLGTMTYATGAAYYHHLPAMRSLLKPLMRALIAKMLRREVWGYWYLTSQSGIRIDPDLKELRKPWANPVCTENVMYSGHILLMVSLYTMLFDDHEFDAPESIVFDWNPIFFGMGRERFCYSKSTLQTAVLKEMERENWMGACCEPNMVFIICNQFPIIATRYNDVMNNTHIVDDVLIKYRTAWAAKGMVAENGLFRAFYSPKRDMVIDSNEIGHTAWAMAFMPWNAPQIQSMYPSTGIGFLHHIDNRINIHPPSTANAIKTLLQADEHSNTNPDDPTLIDRARSVSAASPQSKKPYLSPTFGHVAQWLSEIAGPADLSALLRHADKYMSPTWRDGGLYYARCNTGWDDQGNYTYVEPYSGNAGIGYARLNVLGGQRKMWEEPLNKDQRPYMDGIGLDTGVDALRGKWDDEAKAMSVTLRTWDARAVSLKAAVKNLAPGNYGVYIDGVLKDVRDVAVGEEVVVDMDVGGEEVDLVVLKAPA